MIHHTIKNLTLQQILKFSGYLMILLLIVFYALFQARNLIAGPQITLTENLATTYGERTTLISGTAANIISLSLNGRELSTDEDGHFERTLVLETGYTIMTLRAEDRYGRTMTISKPLVYHPGVPSVSSPNSDVETL